MFLCTHLLNILGQVKKITELRNRIGYILHCFHSWSIILCDFAGLQQQKQWNSSFFPRVFRITSSCLTVCSRKVAGILYLSSTEISSERMILVRHVFFSNSIKSLWHYALINFFYWTPFLFLHNSLFINSIPLSFDLFEPCAALNLLSLFILFQSFCVFCFFRCCECWLPGIRLSFHVGK